jgi:DNA-binding LacI/PurR family transcriptional regulator
MPVTLKQLAHGLGLHHSTVAYALSGKGTVKEATRQRVREVAKEMGYVPNGLARRMRAKKTNVIGLVVPDVVIQYNQFIQQLLRQALAHGYDSQIAFTESQAQWEDKSIRFLMESRVDGMIVKSSFKKWEDVPPLHALRQLSEQGVKTVVYGSPIEGSPFNTVTLPLERQGEMLANHMLELGHKRLAWLGSSVDGEQAQVAGARKALRAAGREADALQVFYPDHAIAAANGECSGSEISPHSVLECGRSLMHKAMAITDRPTAVLCENEMLAIGALAEAQEKRLRVPQDVAIAAADRSVAADLSPIPLTTVSVDASEAARCALDLLLRTMHEQSAKATRRNGKGDDEIVVVKTVTPTATLDVCSSTVC